MGKHKVSFYQTKKKSIDGSVVAHQTDEVTVPDSIPESQCEEERKNLERTGRVICVIGYSIMKQLAIWKHWNKLSKRQSYQVFVSEWGEADVECSVSFEILEHT